MSENKINTSTIQLDSTNFEANKEALLLWLKLATEAVENQGVKVIRASVSHAIGTHDHGCVDWNMRGSVPTGVTYINFSYELAGEKI